MNTWRPPTARPFSLEEKNADPATSERQHAVAVFESFADIELDPSRKTARSDIKFFFFARRAGFWQQTSGGGPSAGDLSNAAEKKAPGRWRGRCPTFSSATAAAAAAV
jgi:hypothetical protein